MNEFFTSHPFWYVIGFIGQALFSSRFLVQWWATERQRRVVIPVAFWYFSLLGGAVLLLYAWHQRDPVFAIGQAAGLLVYGRNLTWALRHREPAAP